MKNVLDNVLEAIDVVTNPEISDQAAFRIAMGSLIAMQLEQMEILNNILIELRKNNE